TSWCASSPARAVTRPPPPRRAVRLPSSARSYETGARFATTRILRRSVIRGPYRGGSGRDDDLELDVLGVRPEEPVEEREPVAQQARREEVPPHVLLAHESAGAGGERVGEDLETRSSALLRGVDQPAADTVLDLGHDPADTAGHGRPGLPERFGD